MSLYCHLMGIFDVLPCLDADDVRLCVMILAGFIRSLQGIARAIK